MNMERKLYTYSEIQHTEKDESAEGWIIKFEELPNYVFTWEIGSKNVTLWVTNGIASLKESLFQYLYTMEAKSNPTKKEVDEIAQMVAFHILAQIQSNTLISDLKFQP